MNKRDSKAGIYLLIVILLILLVSGSALAVIYLQSQKQIIPDTTSVDASDTSQPVISNDDNIPSNKLINAKHIYQLENWPTGCVKAFRRLWRLTTQVSIFLLMIS